MGYQNGNGTGSALSYYYGYGDGPGDGKGNGKRAYFDEEEQVCSGPEEILEIGDGTFE